MKYNNLSKPKIRYIITCLVVISFAYWGGFVTGVKRYFPFELVISLKNEFNYFTTNDLLGWDTCEIKEISELPSSHFSVFIGHAYGAGTKTKLDGFIAPSVEGFLRQNIQNIQNIIFTGDVFNVPDSSKWNKLFEKFGSAKIYVAPGNHDVLRPDSKEIFFQNNLIRSDFPFDLPFGNLTVVVENSISSNWGAGEDIKVLLEKIGAKEVIIARHNIPISQLRPYANSNAGNPDITSVDEFIQGFPKSQNFTWIMGDGGAFKYLPRITCNSYKNHRFVVNGIGETKNDTLLILHDGNIFSHIIK